MDTGGTYSRGLAYDVFFSYRHKPLDAVITQKAFNMVESYRLPGTLRRRGYKDVQRAFRDTEELPVSRVLTDTIDQALRCAKCLIVVCSTDTPDSEWIDREVSLFIELGRADRIYPLLITGNPDISFPPSLKRIPDIQERIMDIRVPGNPVKAMTGKAATELLRAIAGMTGCPEPELIREHMLWKNRRFLRRSLAVCAAFAAFVAVSLGLMHLAQNYREAAFAQEEASMRILQELTYTLPDRLTNIPGAYRRMAGILTQNTEDINSILLLSKDRERAEVEAAANYEKLSNVTALLGELQEALNIQDLAIAYYDSMAITDSVYKKTLLASAWNNRGRICNGLGQYADAETAFARALDIYEDAGSTDVVSLAKTWANRGANFSDLGDGQQAAKCFDQSLSALSLCGSQKEMKELTAEINYNYGLLQYRSGDYEAAISRLNEAVIAQEDLCKMEDSLIHLTGNVKVKGTLAACLTDAGNYTEAEQIYNDAVTLTERLVQLDSENMDYLRLHAELLNNRALNRNIRGDYDRADEDYSRAADCYSMLCAQTGAAADRAMLALALLNCGENAFKQQQYEKSGKWFREGLACYAEALPELGEYDLAQYGAWYSYYLLIHGRDTEAALSAALEARDLQPDSVLVNLNLAYAFLYSGNSDEAAYLLTAIANLGSGQAETIRRDLEAQQKAGLETPYLPALLEILPG